MNKNNPWKDIKTPTNDLNVRQIKGTKNLPLCWGKDSVGHCVFVIELEGDHAQIFNKNLVSVHGIKTDLRILNSTTGQGLVITLENHADQDLFVSLCGTLIEALNDVSDSAVGLSVALSQIKRWKTFLAGRRARMLTDEEIRGLFSELMFIQSMLKESFSENDVLEAWQGPENSHQDFIFSNIAVEIKSLSGKERNTVHISSEDQLEGLSERLYLQVFKLANMPESEKSASLNELVKKLEKELKDADALEKFAEKLAKAGYIEIPEYDLPKFFVIEKKTYLITETFPRLIRSEIHDGIIKVSYQIKLEVIEPFKCNNQDLWDK